MISQHLMQLGDEATGKFGGITRELDSSTEKLKNHGEALDRAAEAARNDIAVLLEDLPRAEQTAREVAEQLRSVGSEFAAKVSAFGQQIDKLTERSRDADEMVADAADRLRPGWPKSKAQVQRGIDARRRGASRLFGHA